MTELELLQQINDKLQHIDSGLTLFVNLYLFFSLISWARRILNKWKRGQGVNE